MSSRVQSSRSPTAGRDPVPLTRPSDARATGTHLKGSPNGPAPDTTLTIPLVVDLDGTLIRSDMLVETVVSALSTELRAAHELLAAGRVGRAALKDRAASLATIDAATLPYDASVLAMIDHARAAGRPVYLASASNERLVAAVALHLDVFDGWFASTADLNLNAEAKADKLVAAFGERGFDYVGNDAADLPVWQRARKAIAIRTSDAVEHRLATLNSDVSVIPTDATGWRAWTKLLRVHQYAKNVLVFVPLVAAHAFAVNTVLTSLIAFIAFSLCASGVYILNDLVDLNADRAHPTKKNRPLANGTVPILHAVIAAPLLLAAALALAFLTTPMFAAMLGVYLALTTAYTFYLKRKMLLDAVSLAGLYTMRVIGGAAAIGVPVSRWLLAFSIFIFMSLALVKRYIELAKLLDRNLPDPANRGYEKGDLPIIASLAAAAGYNSVIVLALYVSSDSFTHLYKQPFMLWLALPIVMYWISRLILKAHRRLIDDDPVVFALKDPVSLAAAAAIGVLGLLAL